MIISKRLVNFKYILLFLFLTLVGAILFFYPRKSYSEFKKKEYIKNEAIQIKKLDSIDKDDSTVWSKYQIVINPDEKKLNKGKEYSVKNIFENIEIDSKSIQFCSKKIIKWDVDDTITYHIPDSTKVVITYNAKNLSSEKEINNRVELLNYYDDLLNDDIINIKKANNTDSSNATQKSATLDIIYELDWNEGYFYRSSENVWPEELNISIQLLADGNAYGTPVVLNKDNYYYTFDDVPRYREDGETEIVYSFADVTLDDFNAELTSDVGTDSTIFRLSLSQKLYTISGSITWNNVSPLFLQMYSESAPVSGYIYYGYENFGSEYEFYLGKEVKYGESSYELTEVPKYYYTEQGKIPLTLKFESEYFDNGLGEKTTPIWTAVIDGYNLNITHAANYDFIIGDIDSSLYPDATDVYAYNYYGIYINSNYGYYSSDSNLSNYSGTITATLGTISKENGEDVYTDIGVIDLEFTSGHCNVDLPPQTNKNFFIRLSDVPREMLFDVNKDYSYGDYTDTEIYVLEDNVKKVAEYDSESYYSAYSSSGFSDYHLHNNFNFSSVGVIFANKLKTRNLLISNQIYGNMANINKEFDYTLLNRNYHGDSINLPVTYGTISNDGDNLIYTSSREGTLTLDASGVLNFKLKHNEYISIPVMPEDDFYLQQVDDTTSPDYEEYDTSMGVLDYQHQPIDSSFLRTYYLDEHNKSIEFAVASYSYDGYPSDEDFTLKDVEVKFSNTRDSGGGAFTGVYTNIMFYIILLVSVMIIGIGFGVLRKKNKKKRKDFIYEEEII